MSNLGFEVQGSYPEHEPIIRRIVSISEYVGLAFKMTDDDGSNTSFDRDIELAARVAVALLDNAGLLNEIPSSAEFSRGESDVPVVAEMIEEGTIDAYNLSLRGRSKKAHYDREFRSVFNVEPGSKYGYPGAGVDTYSERLRAEKRRRIVDPEGTMTEEEYDETFTYISEEDGCDDEYRELDYDLYFDGKIIDQAQRQVLLAKLGGWLQLAAKQEAPSTVVIPDVDDPEASHKLRKIQLNRFSSSLFPELEEITGGAEAMK